jgi:predicted transcriptional regulator of viral defense system
LENAVAKESLFKIIRRLNRPVFSTRELAALSGKSFSSTTQGLARLTRQGILLKVRRGLWADPADERLNAFAAVPFLVTGGRAYVSFLSALHSYGIIEQIPRVATLAATVHSKTLRTALGTFMIHRITPAFFAGFDWNPGRRTHLIAEPEKALVDSLYLSAHKNKQYRHFPELRFPRAFSFRRAAGWARKIPSPRVRARVLKDLERLRFSALT